MKKFLFRFAVVTAAAVFIWLFYFNSVVFPARIKASLISELSSAMKKDISLGSVNYNIFKGFVFRDFAIQDKGKNILSAGKVTCRVRILPLFKKEIFISAIRIKDAGIFIERNADGAFNLAGLVPKDYKPSGEFRVHVDRIVLKGASADFLDMTFPETYAKRIDNMDADIKLSGFPSARFKVSFQIAAAAPTVVKAEGEFQMLTGSAKGKITVNGLQPPEIKPYCEMLGLSLPAGFIDSSFDFALNGPALTTNTEAFIKGLVYVKDDLRSELDGKIKFSLDSDFEKHTLDIKGVLSIENMTVEGMGLSVKADKIKGDVVFDDSGIRAENLGAELYGAPVRIKLNVVEAGDILLDVYISSDMDLAELKKLLKNNAGIDIPAEISGPAHIVTALGYRLDSGKPPSISGTVEAIGCVARADKMKPIENLKGDFRFTPERLSWDGVTFSYENRNFVSDGTLVGFIAPLFDVSVASDDLKAAASFTMDGSVVKFSRLNGRYLNSTFDLTGMVDMSAGYPAASGIKGEAYIRLEDLEKIYADPAAVVHKIKPKGAMRAELSLDGDLKDIRKCRIDARCSGSVSVYGYSLDGLGMNYSQKDGLSSVKFLNSGFYGGTLSASGGTESKAKSENYWLSAEIKDADLARLKSATALKDLDISGRTDLKVYLRGLNGKSVSSLSGSGSIKISEGKLWQLNLFKGLGVLIFTRDFSNIVFNEGKCNFHIRDSFVSTDDLELKSELLDMYGRVRIGFDKTINALLKTEINSRVLAERRGRGGMAQAMGDYGIIDVRGTLKEPKFTIRPDVTNIFEDIRDSIF